MSKHFSEEYNYVTELSDVEFLKSLGITKESFAEIDDFMDADIYDSLYERFMHEMPYGTAKARTGDPHQWLYDHIEGILQ